MRTALRFLRYRVGGPLAAARRCPRGLGVKVDTIGKVLRGGRDVTANLAYSVARLTDVSIDDLLAGARLSPALWEAIRRLRRRGDGRRGPAPRSGA